MLIFRPLRFVYPIYISFRKYKWAHFTRKEIFFFFSRAPYILRTTYFFGDNGGRLYFKMVGGFQQLLGWRFDWSKMTRVQASLFGEGQDSVSHHNAYCSGTSCGGINPYTPMARLGLARISGLDPWQGWRAARSICLASRARKENKLGDQARSWSVRIGILIRSAMSIVAD
jgi:hypothetical protein